MTTVTAPIMGTHLRQITVSDLEAIRTVLSGDSVIDWFRLNFETAHEVELFLRVNGYDVHNVSDLHRLHRIRQDAAAFLHQALGYEIPDCITDPAVTIVDMLLRASRSRRRDPEQSITCLLLKVMHTVHHLDARELQHRCELSESEVYGVVVKRVESAIETMRRENFHIVEYYGSHKDKASTVTKLLAKKENHAAAIYDKIRFRIITQTQADILSVLFFLGRTVCPFNYVIPGASHNNLISFAEMAGLIPRFQHYASYVRRKQRQEKTKSSDNPFTSDAYRVINFVSDIPIRVDEMLYTPDFVELGRIIFVPVEFQVLDADTYRQNESGEGSHHQYKFRQVDAVRKRLGI